MAPPTYLAVGCLSSHSGSGIRGSIIPGTRVRSCVGVYVRSGTQSRNAKYVRINTRYWYVRVYGNAAVVTVRKDTTRGNTSITLTHQAFPFPENLIVAARHFEIRVLPNPSGAFPVSESPTTSPTGQREPGPLGRNSAVEALRFAREQR